MSDDDRIPDITEFYPGIRVVCAGKWHGVVVFNTVLDQYAVGYEREDWQDQGAGFMILYDEVGLVFERAPNEDHELEN